MSILKMGPRANPTRPYLLKRLFTILGVICLVNVVTFGQGSSNLIAPTGLHGNNVPITITNFNGASNGKYVVDLNFLTNTYNTKASMKAKVDLDAGTITASEYSHFASQKTNDALNGNGTASLTTQSQAYCQFKLYLSGNTLYAMQLMNPGGDAAKLKLEASSWKKMVVNGQRVTYVAYTGSDTGTFEQTGTKTWAEYKAGSRTVHATFTETHRDEWSVYLTKNDGARLQIDLHTKQIKYNGQFLFQVAEVRSTAVKPQAPDVGQNSPDHIIPEPTPDDPRKRNRLTPLSKDKTAKIEGTNQSSTLNMRVNGFLYAYTQSPQQKLVHLTTEGSIARAGAQAFNQTDKRGYFLEKLEIIIEPTTGAQHVYRDVDAPPTDNNTGSRTITSSVNVSGGVNQDGGSLNLGMGGANSWSQNINGFKYLNRSSGKKLHHVVQLASSSVGPYNKYQDLLDDGFEGSFSGTPLGTLPDQAINNMPFLAQGVWQTYNGNFTGTVTFKVTYKMTLRYVEKTNYFFVADMASSTTAMDMTEYFTVNFGSIN